MIKDLPKTNGQDTVVGENVQVSGKLHTSSNIQINGKVKGEIVSEGIVVIGKTAMIEGPVVASEVKVEGIVNGNIASENETELSQEAKVYGDIQSKTLSIQSGAIFVGRSIMGESSKKEKPVGKKEVKETEPKPELEVE